MHGRIELRLALEVTSYPQEQVLARDLGQTEQTGHADRSIDRTTD